MPLKRKSSSVPKKSKPQGTRPSKKATVPSADDLRTATTPRGFNATEPGEDPTIARGDVSILYCTDLHLWHRNLGSRAGSYASDVLNKLREVMRSAATDQCPAVLLGGDTFDKPNPDIAVVNAFLSSILRYLHAGGQVLVALGEHDLYGRAAESYIRGPVGTLAMAGSLSGQVVVMCNDTDPSGTMKAEVMTDAGPVTIGAIPPPVGEFESGILFKQLSDLRECEIVMLHHPVSPVSLPYPHVLAEDLPSEAGQICLCGHMHRPFGIKETRYGGLVVGPGSLARTERGEDHPPAVVKLTRQAGAWKPQIIKVTASPHGMVFGAKNTTDEFVEAVGEVKEDVSTRAARMAEGAARAIGGLVGSALTGLDRLKVAVAEEKASVQKVTTDCYEEANRRGQEDA